MAVRRLRPYRIKLDEACIGCGVTAFDVEDALALIQARCFRGAQPPPARQVIRGVAAHEPDENHVRPAIGVMLRRGLWYPDCGLEPLRQGEVRNLV